MNNKTTIALLSAILLFSANSSDAMKGKGIIHKAFINKNGIKHAVYNGMNFKTIKNNTLSKFVSSNEKDSTLEGNETSESKQLAKIVTSQYKGFDKNTKFKISDTQKRYFSTTKRNQGPIGATIGAFVGKIAVSVAGHGAIYIIGGLTWSLGTYDYNCFGEYFWSRN